MTEDPNSTTRDDCPLFKSWTSWYILVLVSNTIVVSLIYLIIKLI